MKHEKFSYNSLEEVSAKIKELGVELPISENVSLLKEDIKIGSVTASNRLAIQPMEGCDGLLDGTPAQLTLRRYDRFARSGAGMIWSEAVAVVPEGRANPRQLMITKDNLDTFKRMVDQTKDFKKTLWLYAADDYAGDALRALLKALWNQCADHCLPSSHT